MFINYLKKFDLVLFLNDMKGLRDIQVCFKMT